MASPARRLAPRVTSKTAAAGDQRRRLLERIGAEAATIQRALPALHASVLALAEVEGTRKLTTEERSRRRDLRLQMEAHQLRMQELHAEFETLRAGRPS